MIKLIPRMRNLIKKKKAVTYFTVHILHSFLQLLSAILNELFKCNSIQIAKATIVVC